MWSIDYVVEEPEQEENDEEISMNTEPAASLRSETTALKVEAKLEVQESEELKSESDVRSESEPRSEDTEPAKRERALKRVEELVKQMSLSRDSEGLFRYSSLLVFFAPLHN